MLDISPWFEVNDVILSFCSLYYLITTALFSENNLGKFRMSDSSLIDSLNKYLLNKL